MKSRVIGIILAVMFVLTSNISYGAVELTKAYKIDDGVTVHLPEDWTEISREQLDLMAGAIAENMGTRPRFDFGFQLEGVDYIDYPYMIVSNENVGRIRESELSNIKKVEKELNNVFDSLENKYDDFIGDVNIGEQVYDEEGKRLISRMKTDVAGVGSVYMLIGMQLTSKGYIQFMLYCEESEYGQYEEVFSQIINSIEVTGNALYDGSGTKQDTGADAAGADAADTGAAGADTAGIGTGGTDTATGIDIVPDSNTAGSDARSMSTASRGKNPKKQAAISPILIAAIILVIGIILFIIMRSKGNDTNTGNTSKSGHSDWFCPKCRYGNPASTSVCQNCNHSIV